MRRISRLLIILCLIFVTQAACNLPLSFLTGGPRTPTPPPAPTPPPTSSPNAPVGTYICNGSENGMLTGIALFRILPGGVIEQDGPNAYKGTWTYNDQTRQFTFSGLRDVDHATYDPQNADYLTFHFLEIPQHAASNDVGCYREEHP